MFDNVPGGFAGGVAASTVMSVACGRMLGARGGEGPVLLRLLREVSGSVLPKKAQIDCVALASHLLLRCITIIQQHYPPSERSHPRNISPLHVATWYSRSSL